MISRGGGLGRGNRKDPAWKYGDQVEGEKSYIYIKCKFCSKVITGGVKRMKDHLAKTHKNVTPCEFVPLEVMEEMKAFLEMGGRIRRRDQQKGNPEEQFKLGASFNPPSSIPNSQPGSSGGSTGARGSIERFVSNPLIHVEDLELDQVREQEVQNSASSKENPNKVYLDSGRFDGIAYNAARSSSFHNMMASVIHDQSEELPAETSGSGDHLLSLGSLETHAILGEPSFVPSVGHQSQIDSRKHEQSEEQHAEISGDHLHSFDSLDTTANFADLPVVPHVVDQYQMDCVKREQNEEQPAETPGDHLVSLDPLEETAKNEQSEEQPAETSGDCLLSLDPLEKTANFEEPSVGPRVGDQYQVKIPLLTTEVESSKLRRDPGIMLGFDKTGMGLEIPIMWVQQADSRIKYEEQKLPDTEAENDAAGSVNSRDSEFIGAELGLVSGCPRDRLNHHDQVPQGTAYQTETPNDMSGHNKVKQPTNKECTVFGSQMNTALPHLQRGKVEGYSPLPCLPCTPWTEAEEQNFLLALYLFGKNFVEVKNFIEKEQGDVLSYYYGNFYRSQAYRRWTDCRKARSRRCIQGQRIITGWRQQELLSRLIAMMSTDVQHDLHEATKIFNEGRASLEEYVHTLKAAVGLQALVKAIGIGKGKKDLTGMALEPVRRNQGRPEIPIGKACSSLTSGQIIDYLTADIRISKARSNDLFWEAVWPRLLARGWHSEQPKHLSSVGSNHALVFLVPGIKKFSRKKLAKGSHYFDSIRDVLNQVAVNPHIIELDDEAAKGESDIKDKYGSDMDAKLDQNGLPDRSHCYLRPRLSNYNSEHEKFTVVDTSFVQGDTPFNISRLRSLPLNMTSCYIPSAPSRQTGNKEYMPAREMHFDQNDSKTTAPVSQTSTPVDSQVPDDEYLDLLDNNKLANDNKHHFSRRRKSRQSDSYLPSANHLKPTSCSNGVTQPLTGTFPRDHQLKKNDSEERHVKLEPYSDVVGQAYNHVLNRRSTVVSKHESHVMIDLNLPVLPEIDPVEPFYMEAVGNCHGLEQSAIIIESSKHPVDSQMMGNSNGVLSDQYPSTSSRRHSTRSRPPTAKALEALANGSIGTKRKGRGYDSYLSNSFSSRPSRRARKTVESPTAAAFSSDIREPNEQIGTWYITNENNETILSSSHTDSKRQGIHEFLGLP